LFNSFDDLILSDKNKILERLSMDEESNPFLWDILNRVYETSSESEKDKIQKAALKVIVNLKKLHRINQILGKHESILHMLITDISNLKESILRDILHSSSVKDIIFFLKLLEDEKQEEVLRKVINSLNKDEWENKFSNSDSDSVYFMKYWIVNYFHKELNFDQLLFQNSKSIYSKINMRKKD
jgi:hypothetical protein